MAQTARIFFDIDASLGNYICDIDGNRYLDAFRNGKMKKKTKRSL